MRVEELGLRVRSVAPDEDALRTDVDVDPGEVPVEEALHRPRRRHAADGRQLLDRLAGIALAVLVEVAVVDLRRALHQHRGRILELAARRIGEEQRDQRVRGRVVGLLRIAEPGRHVDGHLSGPVVGRDRPGDRLPAPVDRRVLGRDEPVEDCLDVLRKRRRHRGASIWPLAQSGAQPGRAHIPARARLAWISSERNLGASWSLGAIVSGTANPPSTSIALNRRPSSSHT